MTVFFVLFVSLSSRLLEAEGGCGSPLRDCSYSNMRIIPMVAVYSVANNASPCTRVNLARSFNALCSHPFTWIERTAQRVPSHRGERSVFHCSSHTIANLDQGSDLAHAHHRLVHHELASQTQTIRLLHQILQPTPPSIFRRSGRVRLPVHGVDEGGDSHALAQLLLQTHQHRALVTQRLQGILGHRIFLQIPTPNMSPDQCPGTAQRTPCGVFLLLEVLLR